MSAPVLITPPATPLLTIEDVARHCRIDAGDDDPYLVTLIEAATLLAERWTLRSFVTRRLEMRLDAFPAYPLPLDRPPIVSVTTVKYDDAAGEQTIAPEYYRLVGEPDASLALAYGQTTWPTPLDFAETVRVRYDAGYGTSADVPAAIKHAVLLFIGHWYANREAVALGATPAELPIAAESLLSAYRIPVL